MTSCILLSHVFIKPNEEHKLDIVNFAVQHYRKHNPDAYIILTGHGEFPEKTKNFCNYIHWKPNIIEKDINVGHPHLINIGLDHAQDKEFTHVLKTRADTIHLYKNILNNAHDKLKDKKLIITQMTKFNTKHMGDLFMYGELNFLKQCWNINTWYPTTTGVTSLANNFLNNCDEDNWIDALKNNCIFQDVASLKWIDLGANWNILKNKQQILDNILEENEKYFWGAKQKWLRFDTEGNHIYSKPKVGEIITEKEWYK